MHARLVWFFFLLGVLGACTSAEEQPAVGRQEQLAVIQAVLHHDSLLLSSRGSRSAPILTQLAPLQLSPRRQRPMPILSRLSVELAHLLSYDYQGSPFFTPADTLFFQQQVRQQRVATLDTTLFEPADLLSPQANALAEAQLRGSDFYVFSQPLFSLHRSRAYIQKYHDCAGCSQGREYFLVKKGTSWVVVDWEGTWRE